MNTDQLAELVKVLERIAIAAEAIAMNTADISHTLDNEVIVVRQAP